MKISIVIPTYNQTKYLENLNRQIIKLNKSYKIIVVDDSGTGKISKNINNKFKGIKTISNNSNYGFSSSVNIGIRESMKTNPDYILILNDDMKIIDNNFIEKMIEVGNRFPSVGIIGCSVYLKSGKRQYPKTKKEGVIEVNDIIGCCYLIKRKVILRIGLFDEGFNKAYGEESDYCFRAKKEGFKLICVTNASIFHYNESSTKSLGNYTKWYLRKRNSIRLEWKHYNIKDILKYTIIHFLSIIKGNPIYLPKRFFLLIKAYVYNFKRIDEIRRLRYEYRN